MVLRLLLRSQWSYQPGTGPPIASSSALGICQYYHAPFPGGATAVITAALQLPGLVPKAELQTPQAVLSFGALAASCGSCPSWLRNSQTSRPRSWDRQETRSVLAACWLSAKPWPCSSPSLLTSHDTESSSTASCLHQASATRH